MQQSVFDLDHLSRTYFKLALPVVLGMAVTLIYNLADTYFIARTGNTDLVAGVSLCAPVFTALMAFGNIYGQGGSSLISRMLGRNDRDGTARVSSFCFYAAIVTGLVLAVPAVLFRLPLLRLIGAKEATLPYASEYFTVLAGCAPIVILNFIHSNLLRCEGMSGLSMAGSVGGALLNIALDPIFISVLGLGARGAAIATVLGYVFTDVFLLVMLLRRSRYLSVVPRDCRVDRDELRQILGIGVTAAITNLASSLCLIVMNKYLAAYGSAKVAAMGIALKINMIGQSFLIGFAFGGVPLFGFLYGAEDKARLWQLIRFCLVFMCSLAAALSAGLILAARPLMGVFIHRADVIADGAVMLRWQAAGNVFAAAVMLLTCLFQAAGRMLPSFLLSVSRQGVVFLGVLAAAVALAGYGGLLAAQAIADLVSALLALGLYLAVFGRKNT